MSGTIQSDTGAITAEKAPGATLDYTLDYSQQLPPGASITGSTWSAAPGLTISGSSFTATVATVLLSGGTGGTWYLVSNVATTSTADVLTGSMRVYVSDPAGLGGTTPSVFLDFGGAVAELRTDRLVRAVASLPMAGTFSDRYLAAKLRAAEADLQRRLRVFLTPHEMIPPTTDPADLAAVVASGVAMANDPGYDFSPDLFNGDTFGLIQLRQKPLISVSRIWFTYPAPDATVFDVPLEWVRPDAKYGRINLVPTQQSVTLPLNIFLFAALGGGRSVPFMVQVRYRAGLQDVANTAPDILDLIRYMAVLSIVDDAFIPQSGSTSADGLSQSLSWEADKLRDRVEKRVTTLRESLNGVRAGFC